jgi:hypothetical protein
VANGLERKMTATARRLLERTRCGLNSEVMPDFSYTTCSYLVLASLQATHVPPCRNSYRSLFVVDKH